MGRLFFIYSKKRISLTNTEEEVLIIDDKEKLDEAISGPEN